MNTYYFTNNWFELQKPIINELLLHKNKPLAILEIGCHEGRSTTYYIDNYLEHPDSKIISIDPFDCNDKTSPVNTDTKNIFLKNISLSKYPSKSDFIEKYSHEALKELLNKNMKFDFISIDGSHLSSDVLLDAELSFQLLNENGILFFDDYLGGDNDRDTNTKWSKIGIDTFLNKYKNKYILLHKNYHVAIRKINAIEKNDKKIYDCFIFCNEIDILRMRLKELENYVDVFVITEATFTFTGIKKKLYFNEIKNEFKKYNIIHLIIDNYIEGDPWENETYQRNFALQYLKNNVQTNDSILLCDVDEIPNANILKDIKINNFTTVGYLEMDLYYYNFNWLKKQKWIRASIVSVLHLNNMSLQEIRNGVLNMETIKNGGWHLSYFMPVELIKNKIQSFSHQEFNKEKYLNSEYIQKCIESGIDLFDRGENENLIKRTTEILPVNIFLINSNY